jgi:hypothetical protein
MLTQPQPPRILIIHENEDFSDRFCNLFLPYSDAMIMKCNYDIIRINQLINSIELDYIVVDFDERNSLLLKDFNEVNLDTRKECKVILLSKLEGLKEKLQPFTINLPPNGKNAYKHHSQSAKPHTDELIGLPTNTGIRFVNKSEIVLFRYAKKSESSKERWEVLLCSSETLQLKINTTSKDIFKLINDTNFIQLCQKCIINLKYLKSIETKTHRCILHEPFDKMEILISRSCLNEIKERFDM